MTDLITRENSSFSTTIQRFETFVVFDKFSFYLRGVLFSRFVHYDNQNKEKLFSNLVSNLIQQTQIKKPYSFKISSGPRVFGNKLVCVRLGLQTLWSHWNLSSLINLEYGTIETRFKTEGRSNLLSSEQKNLQAKLGFETISKVKV